MILADKIIRLRKKNGWSQEELADKMNVSRQAVSKWEAAQTTPDLEKILQLGNLFGVTTDYLLKDELVDEEFVEGVDETPIRKISLAEKLLKEGEFSEKGKQKNKIIEAIGTVYWLLATAIYLGWSFLTSDWHITWVIWPIAGVLFAVVELVCNLVIDKQVEK